MVQGQSNDRQSTAIVEEMNFTSLLEGLQTDE